MTIYEQNLEVLKTIRPDLYAGLQNAKERQIQVLVGDALDGEKFLALVDGDNVSALNSTYHPSHEAERYAKQFDDEAKNTILILFGLGNGLVVEKVMAEECPVDKCIVYEPSVDIFEAALEEYDLREILRNEKMLLLVKGINDDMLEKVLYEHMNYRNWNHCLLSVLSKYDLLFEEEYMEIREIYLRTIAGKRGEKNALVCYAQAGMINEVKALKWMMNCRTLDSMKHKFPEEIPCIVVAAGPSLEKNVEELRRAKGKALIICVDTALKFLLERDIIPDMTCTVDPKKGTSYFQNPKIKHIPIALSTDSDYRSIEAIGEVEPIYISTTYDYYKEMFRKKGLCLEYLEGGGSVGTVCFQLGIELGFRTIILVGQDLAFSDDKAHAGMGELKQSDLFYNLLKVEGYYGGEVLTRGDFKSYIDWYNMTIPEIKDRTIINATEGGAKLKGAIQMPLSDAVERYCVKDWDIEEILNQIPKVWNTQEERKEQYEELQKKYLSFRNLKRNVTDGIHQAERAISLLERGNYQQRELDNIDKKLEAITQEVSGKSEMMILIKRMIDADIAVAEGLQEVEDDLLKESIRLYKKMRTYLQNLLEAVDELLPIWKDVLSEINEMYGFE